MSGDKKAQLRSSTSTPFRALALMRKKGHCILSSSKQASLLYAWSEVEVGVTWREIMLQQWVGCW
ncbi:hypothetical protein SESBI_44425 [Sesbania bispinosa]|nr:hypothetical protein SESBI_44425 [Sesbania bispinosa]